MAQDWHAGARALAQRAGLDPRYLRRLRWIRKARAVRHAGGSPLRWAPFVLFDPEPDNFTYELDNEDELATWVAAVTGRATADAARLLGEARDDAELARRLQAATRRHRAWSKPAPPFGKRLGWYALVRLLQPEIVVEAGVHDGLGSLVLLRALERNRTGAGVAGRLISFDVNPAAGWLVGRDPAWDLRVTSTQTGLTPLLAELPGVDLFLHDSDHAYAHERFELATVAAHLRPGGVLMSDNVHATSALAEVSSERGLAYHAFTERPRGHFYSGGGVGAARRAPAPETPAGPALH